MSDETVTFFTSDQHYGHETGRVGQSRPRAANGTFSDELVYRHNFVVRPQDHVWHLGDFANETHHAEEYLKRLNGVQHLASGNHDGSHPSNRRGFNNIARYLEMGFKTVVERGRLTNVHFGGVVVCHLPLLGVGDHTEVERFAAWRLAPEVLEETGARYLLHGHVHTAWKVRGSCINVGVDVWDFAPVRDYTLGQFIRGYSAAHRPSAATPVEVYGRSPQPSSAAYTEGYALGLKESTGG